MHIHSHAPDDANSHRYQQSQTQSGRRYTPHLTRFYTSQSPMGLMSLIVEAVTQLGVKSKQGSPDEANPERLRLRVGGYDRRREMFKGWIEVEPFVHQGSKGSFCIMSRDQVCFFFGFPILW